MHYPIVIHKDIDSDYGVIVPDLPGCFSAGSTLEEAINMAREAIECHIGGLLLDGGPLPALQAFEIHQANPEYAGGIWCLIDIDLSLFDDQAEQINITLPHRVLHRLDAHAQRKGETRSSFLARAALQAMREDIEQEA
jgi:predicted RNase H-like HicB family nuclease